MLVFDLVVFQDLLLDPTVLLRRALHVAQGFCLGESNGLAQLPQAEDFVSIFGDFLAGVELSVADAVVLGHFSGLLGMGHLCNVADGRRWCGGVEPDAAHGAGKLVLSILVVLGAGLDVGHVIGFDAHEDVFFEICRHLETDLVGWGFAPYRS